ncbi:MAG: hypothetical protein KatS3mg077_2948 [Candidatus Binatia bacterium]|nr:MAG: hypothetical protein KatS3mg077_2948 [Candidatus Binatia bacterium]
MGAIAVPGGSVGVRRAPRRVAWLYGLRLHPVATKPIGREVPGGQTLGKLLGGRASLWGLLAHQG